MPTSFLVDGLRRFYDRYPILVQMVVWLAFIMLPDPFITTQRLFSPEGVIAYELRFFTSLLGAVLFYLNFYVITPYLLRRNRLIWLLLVTPFLVILVVLSTNILYQSIAQGDLSTLTARMLKFQQTIFQQQKILSLPFPVVITTGLVVVVMISTSTGFAIYRDRNEVQTRHQQMEIEKKQAELNALKLQISPHFLFNTLNNMRWLARQKSDQTEDAILRLSDILRYMIYQVNEGPVPLSKEIDYLTDYVALQKLRLGDHNRVTFETDVDNDRVRVEPLLLIHFVENAFKHGMHHDEPSTVSIRLHVRDGLLTFETCNRLFYEAPEQPSPDSGVGVQNVERRLALHYPNRHLLRMQHKNGFFCVDLRIDLT